MIDAMVHHGHSWQWRGLFVSKTDRRKNGDAWRNSAVVEGGIEVSKMCIVMASTIGEPLGDGDKSAIVALFVRECMMEVSVTNIFFVPYVSHDSGILGPTMLIC